MESASKLTKHETRVCKKTHFTPSPPVSVANRPPITWRWTMPLLEGDDFSYQIFRHCPPRFPSSPDMVTVSSSHIFAWVQFETFSLDARLDRPGARSGRRSCWLERESWQWATELLAWEGVLTRTPSQSSNSVEFLVWEGDLFWDDGVTDSVGGWTFLSFIVTSSSLGFRLFYSLVNKLFSNTAHVLITTGTGTKKSNF